MFKAKAVASAAALAAILGIGAYSAFAQDSGTTAVTPSPAPAPAAAAAPAAAPKTLPNGEAIRDCVTPIEGMACIPGGPFLRGSNNDPHVKCDQDSHNKVYRPKDAPNHINTNPESTVWMPTYYMDIVEVTNGAYNACVKDKKCEKDGPLYVDFGAADQPITALSWYHAKQYCEAVGKHLPTEAEWEKAARGENGDMYPWGNEPASCANAVVMNDKGRSCGEIKRRGKKPETGRVLKGCSKGVYRYGLCDMMGNAEEWVADWYTPSWEACGADCAGINPKGPCGGEEDGEGRCGKYRAKSVRGGSWYWPAEHATGLHRRSHYPANKPGTHHFGFRCAATAEEMDALLNKK